MRAFIAVDAVAATELASLQRQLLAESGWTAADVKAVEPANFHFTMFFLGEITEADVANISKALSEIRFESFPVSYTGVGEFPRPETARVIWVGVDPQAERRLDALAAEVAAKMRGLGFQQDKPFSAHLTLFRARDRPLKASDVLAKFHSLSLEGPNQIVHSLHLKRSELRPAGAVYSNVYTIGSSAAM